MSVLKALAEIGFKPTANEDGLFKALKGTYEANIITLRKEVDEKNGNANYYLLELKPITVIEGDTFGDRFTFKRRCYIDGEKAQENLKRLLNDLFTCGVELNTTSEEAMEADFGKAIGVKAYVRAWGWTRKDKDGNDLTSQMFVIQQEKVALKKKKGEAVPF